MSQDEYAYVIELSPTEWVLNARAIRSAYIINETVDLNKAKRFKNKADAGSFIAKYQMATMMDYFITTLVRKSNIGWVKV